MLDVLEYVFTVHLLVFWRSSHHEENVLVNILTIGSQGLRKISYLQLRLLIEMTRGEFWVSFLDFHVGLAPLYFISVVFLSSINKMAAFSMARPISL